MGTIRLSTILFPSNDVRNSAISFSQKASAFAPVPFVLDDQNYFPHITLYAPEYPVERAAEVVDAVRLLGSTLAPVELTFEKIQVTESGGISANYICTEALTALRTKVIETLNPLRETVVRSKYENFEHDETLAEEQKKEVRSYGYELNKYHFPHITLSAFKDKETAEAFLGEYTDTLPSFTSDKIAVSEMGPVGTCTKIIGVFDLSA